MSPLAPEKRFDDPEVPPFCVDEGKKLRIAIIGGGFSGILAAIRVRQKMPHCTAVLYDRLPGVGGTWRANKYPGVAVDTPAHAYTYNFESNPNLNSFFAPGPQILEYLTMVSEKYGVSEISQFSKELAGAEWSQENGLWTLTLRHTAGPYKGSTFADTAHMVIQATGILSEWEWPVIPGIKNFKGTIMHTADWDNALDSKTWDGKRVAVIGNGASGIQVITTCQPLATQLTSYSRNQSYVTGRSNMELMESLGLDITNDNPIFTEDVKQKFREDPGLLKRSRALMERSLGSNHYMTLKGHPGSALAADAVRATMVDTLANRPDIAEKLIPDWPITCRRINPAPGYLRALQQNNVRIEWNRIAEITETGIRTEDGNFEKFDLIVCATGFRNSYIPPFTMKGQNGGSFEKKWKDRAHHYMTVQTDEIPNWSMCMGPNSGYGTGQILMAIEAGVDYALAIAQKISRDHLKSIAVKKSAVDSFMRYSDEYFPRTNFTSTCSAWYKLSNEQVVGIFPGSVIGYKRILAHPRWEDFEIEYDGKDEWYSLGNGYTMAERDGGETGEYLRDVDIPPLPNEDENSWRLRFIREPLPPVGEVTAYGMKGGIKTSGEEDFKVTTVFKNL